MLLRRCYGMSGTEPRILRYQTAPETVGWGMSDGVRDSYSSASKDNVSLNTRGVTFDKFRPPGDPTPPVSPGTSRRISGRISALYWRRQYLLWPDSACVLLCARYSVCGTGVADGGYPGSATRSTACLVLAGDIVVRGKGDCAVLSWILWYQGTG